MGTFIHSVSLFDSHLASTSRVSGPAVLVPNAGYWPLFLSLHHVTCLEVVMVGIFIFTRETGLSFTSQSRPPWRASCCRWPVTLADSLPD